MDYHVYGHVRSPMEKAPRTGAVIFDTVLDELERRDLNTALVTLCVGAGMGTATIIERC